MSDTSFLGWPFFTDRHRALAEAIERKTLENETGLLFGPLPKPAWPDPAEAAGSGWR